MIFRFHLHTSQKLKEMNGSKASINNLLPNLHPTTSEKDINNHSNTRISLRSFDDLKYSINLYNILVFMIHDRMFWNYLFIGFEPAH